VQVGGYASLLCLLKILEVLYSNNTQQSIVEKMITSEVEGVLEYTSKWMTRLHASTTSQNPAQSPDGLLQHATHDAQSWNDLLSCSGGALEIPKYAYQICPLQLCCVRSSSPHPTSTNTSKSSHSRCHQQPHLAHTVQIPPFTCHFSHY
jgi:hypothetical protein